MFTNGQNPYDDLRKDEVVSSMSKGNVHPKIDDSWPIANILTTIFTGNGEVINDGKTLFDSMKTMQNQL